MEYIHIVTYLDTFTYMQYLQIETLYVGIFGVIAANSSVGIRRYLCKNTDRYLHYDRHLEGGAPLRQTRVAARLS
jgi:hypothetical protein